MKSVLLAVCLGSLFSSWAPPARAQTEEERALDDGMEGPRATPLVEPPPVGTDLWPRVTVGLGGGSRRLGPFAAHAAFRTDFFVGQLGLGVYAGYYGFGAPDGNGSEGSFVAPTLSYRARLDWRPPKHDAPIAWESSGWFVASAGAGYATLEGYERVSGEREDFSFEGVVIPAEVGLLYAFGPFLAGGSVDAFVVPSQGYAILIGFHVGGAIGL